MVYRCEGCAKHFNHNEPCGIWCERGDLVDCGEDFEEVAYQVWYCPSCAICTICGAPAQHEKCIGGFVCDSAGCAEQYELQTLTTFPHDPECPF